MEASSIKEKRRGGILVPLSSLLSKYSFESGDIYSLYPLGEFAKEVGFSIIQLLPLNDTGFGTSPYSAISAFAIDPLYISLHDLGIETYTRKKEFSRKINHERIRNAKLVALRKKYEENLVSNQTSAHQFLAKNPWCYAYAAFRQILSETNGSPWWTWKEDYQNPSQAKEICFSQKKDDTLFWVYLQKIAFDQLSAVKEHFEILGIFLKGDMPILTSKNSSDVWEYCDYFELNLHAGAPPDQFSPTGQNWGFPVLKWDVLKKTGYQWWKDRLRYLEHFFHLYRIDHVIGMYRIWAVPSHEETAVHGWFHPQIGTPKEKFLELGLNPDEFVAKHLIYEFKKDSFIFTWDFWKKSGYVELAEEIKAKLYPLSELNLANDENDWKEAGEEILDVFTSQSSMLPCAEDLGSVPNFIRESLSERQMLGIDVVRWTKSFETGDFIPPEGYRKFAISTLSTHDTSLVMDWWKREGNLDEKIEHFFTKRGKEKPNGDSEVLAGLLEFVFQTKSVFSIVMLQDICLNEPEILSKPEEHRINVPGTSESLNWNYRFPYLIEDFANNVERNQALRSLLIQAGRL